MLKNLFLMVLSLKLLGEGMTLASLECFKDEALKKMEDASFLSVFERDYVGCARVLWSRGPAISIVPYELEMAGVTPSKMNPKEPSSKKNACKHYYSGDGIGKVEVYNSRGELHEVECFVYFDGRVCALKKNRHGENLWLKIAEIENGRVTRACRVDLDAEFWSFEYSWCEGVLQKIVTLSSNSLPGVIVFPEYGEGRELEGMYFMRGDVKVYLYQR
ncbi:hypothetical protein D9M71_468710 [compost metagenome]